MSSTTDSDESAAVERTCRSFEKSINDLISKIRKRARRRGDERTESGRDRDATLATECRRLVRHANHVLRTLTAKRASLKRAIEAFGEASRPRVRRLSEYDDDDNDGDAETRRRAVLREWFAGYLRLRDGFVLLESGERRHPGDGDPDPRRVGGGGNDLREERFASRLSGALRSDGATRKHSSRNGYTGGGYDEAYDDELGLVRRLLDALSEMDGGGDGSAAGWSPSDVRDRTFDRIGSGPCAWEGMMDEHISESKRLRGDLDGVRERFVNDVNVRLAGRRRREEGGDGNKVPERLRLVTDDKHERISLGPVDIARQGDAFAVRDAGGSLPFGMTLSDWRRKFGAADQNKKAEKSAGKKKRRRVILEDSSDEEEEEEEATSTKDPCARAGRSDTTVVNAAALDAGDDGLAVRVRRTADAPKDGERTESIDEMKRRHGANVARLERGTERLEEEELRSRMAADDEDMREGFLRGDTTTGAEDRLAKHAPLLRDCLESRASLAGADAHGRDVASLRRAQGHWAELDAALTRWKEDFQEWLAAREGGAVADGSQDESSDRAYTIRDNFREANIILGNECIEIHEFYFELLQKHQSPPTTRSTPAVSSQSSLEEPLAAVCHSYLAFAEATFETALNLVRDHERCHPKTLTKIGEHWEKGQHYLLRGRAHHNVGRALYSLVRYRETIAPGKGRRTPRHESKNLLAKARKEFDDALLMARSLRRNAVAIQGHRDADGASTQSDRSWRAEATMHVLEAAGLEALSSGLHVACSWRMDRVKEAEERFDGFFESVDCSDVVQLSSVVGVSNSDVAEVLKDVYSFAASVAENLTRSLGSLPTAARGWDPTIGERMMRMTLAATQRAASASDRLLSFVRQHSLDYLTEGVAVRAAIEDEEKELAAWWETTKARARKTLSDVVRSARANDAGNSSLPRGEVAGDVGGSSSRAAVPPPGRIFVQDGGWSGGRSSSSRTRRVKKNRSEEDRAVTDRFHSEFCMDNNDKAGGGGTSSLATERANATTVIYRKWGDEVLEESERKPRCPPLPDGIPNHVRLAIEKKMQQHGIEFLV